MFVEDSHYVRFQKKTHLINALLQYTKCEMKTKTNQQWKQIIAKERQPIYGHKCFRGKNIPWFDRNTPYTSCVIYFL